MPITSPPPPEPDLIAQRGTDQWRDAVHVKQQWIAKQLTEGATLDELVDAGVMDKYGEGGSSREGRLSHDYEKWSKALRGEAMGDEGLPGELGEAQWNVGNFRRQASQGDFTEWPPGSGKFFNDPANDPGHREWYDQYGNRTSPPEDGGPDIDYSALIPGETPAMYLKRHASEVEAEKKAKPILPQGGGSPVADVTPTPQMESTPQPNFATPQPNYTNNQPKKPAITGMEVNNGLPSRFNTAMYSPPSNPSMVQTRPRAPKPRRIGSGWYSNWG